MWYVKKIRSGKRYEDGSLPPEVWQQGGVCPTLNAFDNGSESRAVVTVIGTLQSYPRGVPSVEEARDGQVLIVAPTLSASNNPSRSPQSSEVTAQIEATHKAIQQVRRLTPVECERLQGFPDNWTEGLADSHRYKQMGNAVTVNVANYVGLLIMEAASEHV